MTAYQDIIYDVERGAATITINRPEKMNAFRPQTCSELIDAFLKAGALAGRVPAMFRRTNRFALPMELDAEGFGLAMTAYGTARGINLVMRLDTSPAETDAALSAISRFYDDIGF